MTARPVPRMTGALYTFASHALYVGPLIASSAHRHHAGQILCVPGGVDLEEEGSSERRVVAHVVPPRRVHRHGEAALAAVLWVDRDDVRWDAAPGGDAGSLVAWRQIHAAIDAIANTDAAHLLAETMVSWIARADPPRAFGEEAVRHHAVARMRKLLDASVGDPEASVQALAARSGLSVRQLRHRFTQEIGLNPSAYWRWCRLRRAIAALERGGSITAAAVEAGFADGAHFCRVFQAQFGVAPSQALPALRPAAHSAGRAASASWRR